MYKKMFETINDIFTPKVESNKKVFEVCSNPSCKSHILLQIPEQMLPSIETRVEDLRALGYENISVQVEEKPSHQPSVEPHQPSIGIIRQPPFMGGLVIEYSSEGPF